MRDGTHKVLVVTHDDSQSDDVGEFVRGTGAMVLGPARSVAQGLALMADADAAVLDLDLPEGNLTALAGALAERGINFVFVARPEILDDIPQRLRNNPLFHDQCRRVQPIPVFTLGRAGDSLLLSLRLASRLVYGDPAAADRMVERLLHDAIDDARSGHRLSARDARLRWMLGRMQQYVRDGYTDLMN